MALSRGILALCACLLLTGCAKRYRFEQEPPRSHSEWPFHRGDLQGGAALSESSYDGSLDVLWETGAKGKSAGPLTISNGIVAYPSSRDRILFYRLSGGEYLGRFKVKGIPQTGFVTKDSLGFVGLGPDENRVVCFDMKHRDELWRQSVKDAAGGTILIKDRLLVASTDGTLYALAAESGDILWIFRDSLGMAAPPTADSDRVYQTIDDGYLVCLSAADGHEVFRTRLVGPIVSPAAIDSLIFVASQSGILHAVRASTGQIAWRQSLDGGAWNSPAVASETVVCGHSGGKVEAFVAGVGDPLWRRDIGAVVKAGVTIVGDVVVVGTMSGEVITLELATGRIIARRQLDGAITQPPVTDGERIVVATRSGHLCCLGAYNGATRSDNHLGDSRDRLQRAGSLSGSRTGSGHSQGGHLRQRPPDVR